MSLADALSTSRELRAGDVHAGIGGGDVGDVDVEPPLRVPPQHLAIDRVDAAGGRGDVEMLVVEPAGDAVVDDRRRHWSVIST